MTDRRPTTVRHPTPLGMPGAPFVVRQSDLKSWAKCPLLYKYEKIDKLPRLQSASLTFGSIIHDVVLWMEVHRDPATAVARFDYYWADPTRFTADQNDGTEYRIDYYVRATNWRRFQEEGRRILKDWWQLIQWDTALVLGREASFDVPIGAGHVLHGTVDKLELRYIAKLDQWVVMVSDYKTNRKVPTYDYLNEDLQFTAYAYASRTLEFWLQLFPDNQAQAIKLWEQYKDLPRWGEWVSLVQPKRMDAGIREERHYNRLVLAVDALALSVEHRIFVPNISGETCRWCEYRTTCGLPPLTEDGEVPE